MEKQRDKAAKRLQRKLDKNNPQAPDADADGAIEGLDGEFADSIDGVEGGEDQAAGAGAADPNPNPNPREDPTP